MPAEVRELLEVVAKPHWAAFRCSSLFNLKLQMVEVGKIMVPPRSANTELMLIQRLTLQQSSFMLKTVDQPSHCIRLYQTSHIFMLFRRNSTKRK